MLSRRSFILGTAGLAGSAALVSCNSGSSGSADDRQPTGGEVSDKTLIAFFADGNQGPGNQRLAFGIAEPSGEIVTAGPDKLVGKVLDESGAVIVANIEAPRRGEGLPRPYWAFELTLAKPGFYTLDVGGASAAFSVTEASKLEVPAPGQALPALDTPTTTESLGVDPICTRNPACPFHAMTLREAVANGKPTVLLVGTPAHCKTAVCGPVLEHLMTTATSMGDRMNFIHAEVYQDDTINDITQAMLSLRLRYEPVLFVANGSGVIARRLDNVWDLAEQRSAIGLVA